MALLPPSPAPPPPVGSPLPPPAPWDRLPDSATWLRPVSRPRTDGFAVAALLTAVAPVVLVGLLVLLVVAPDDSAQPGDDAGAMAAVSIGMLVVPLCLVLWILAVVFGATSLTRIAGSRPRSKGRGMGIAALVLAGVEALVVLSLVLFAAMMPSYDERGSARYPATTDVTPSPSVTWSEPPLVPAGALDPAVTQATIDSTICNPSWRDSVRPDNGWANLQEQRLAAKAGLTDTSGYVIDFLIPTVLGGDPRAEANQWLQPVDGPWNALTKDQTEENLRARVCIRRITLADAQRLVVDPEQWGRW